MDKMTEQREESRKHMNDERFILTDRQPSKQSDDFRIFKSFKSFINLKNNFVSSIVVVTRLFRSAHPGNSIESTSCSTTVSDRWDGREWERSYITVNSTMRSQRSQCSRDEGSSGSFQIPENHQWNMDHKNRSKGSICLDVRFVRMFSWLRQYD